MILQPKPPEEDERKPAPILVGFNPPESFWLSMLTGMGIGAMAAWMMKNYTAFTETLNVVMILYCALCLAELVKVARNG